MKVLYVHAHPEPLSLNGAIQSFAVEHLRGLGHEVQVSDLYAMRWNAVLGPGDFPARDASRPFHPEHDSGVAFSEGTQLAEVTAEQQKLLWADALILQFPLWWYSMPAIMKGWVERVYAYGFAYGIGEHSDTRWGDRFGEGVMAGKRAMLVVTTGGWESHYGPRGINGETNELLFPIQHGTLYYPGFEVLPPYLVHRTGKVDEARFADIRETLGQRLANLFTDAPIPFRKQNFGDYSIPDMTLKPHLAPGQTGLRVHARQEGEA